MAVLGLRCDLSLLVVFPARVELVLRNVKVKDKTTDRKNF